MKKLIVTACAAVVSALALASTVESSNTFGVLKIDTGLHGTEGRRQFMISVPWEAVGGGSIKAKDLVLPSNLVADDKLYALNSGTTFGAWKISGGTWVSASDMVAVTSGSATVNAADEEKTIPRGTTALIVETAQSAIYLSGQYNDVATGAITLPANSTTLIGAGLPDDKTLTDSMFSPTPSAGDIIFTDGAIFWRNSANDGWVMNGTVNGKPAQVTAVLKKGKGAWYCNNGGSEITLTF